MIRKKSSKFNFPSNQWNKLFFLLGAASHLEMSFCPFRIQFFELRFFKYSWKAFNFVRDVLQVNRRYCHKFIQSAKEALFIHCIRNKMCKSSELLVLTGIYILWLQDINNIKKRLKRHGFACEISNLITQRRIWYEQYHSLSLAQIFWYFLLLVWNLSSFPFPTWLVFG